MDTTVTKLHSVLEDAIQLLEKHNVRNWAEWLKKDIARIQRSDIYGVEHLLSLFGGMGSFNDVYICEENGYSINDDEILIVNERLSELRSEIYDLSSKICKKVRS